MSSSHGCEYDPDKIESAANELKIAREKDPKKPIFFFQHPHLTDTVSGSIYWADESFIPTLMNYPQVIDFSGHSHVPINDPRSIHQRHFTCLGTGSLSYFELDEFDKHYGTCPPKKEDCAQMLIVEADENGAVRIYPYDVAPGVDTTGDGIADEGSLRGSSEVVAERIRNEIQARVDEAGIEIIEARITYLAYAPEIAAVMLQRQQASAIIDARRMIVDGAVGMVEMALERLAENDTVKLDEERKAAMVSNLLVVLCGNKDAQPVVNSGSIY